MSEQSKSEEKEVEQKGNSDVETAAVAGFVGLMFAGPVGAFVGAASGAMYSMLKRELKK